MANLPIQYADYAYWQRQWMQTEAFASQLAYWRDRLMPEPPALQWPTDRPPPASSTYRGAIRPFTISNQLVQRLNAMSRGESVTLFMSLLAGFSALLYRYTNQEDMVIGTLAPSGRKRSEVQNLMGYFLNPVPLRMNLCGNPTFRELLRQARDVVLGAIANDDVPFEYVMAKAGLSSDPNRRPLFEVVISLAPATPDLGPGWSQTFMDVESGGARWGLYLELGDRPTACSVELNITRICSRRPPLGERFKNGRCYWKPVLQTPNCAFQSCPARTLHEQRSQAIAVDHSGYGRVQNFVRA